MAADGLLSGDEARPSAPAPRLHWTHDDGTWVALALDDIDGRSPAQPWTADEIDRVLAALAALADDLTPAPADALPITEDLADNFSSCRRLATGHIADGTGELPAWGRENLGWLAELEDHWPVAATGRTPGPHRPARRHPPHPIRGSDRGLALRGDHHPMDGRADAPALVTGDYLTQSLRPAPPNIPGLRTHQRAKGDATLRLLRTRIGDA